MLFLMHQACCLKKIYYNREREVETGEEKIVQLHKFRHGLALKITIS
jgi:hypothetical protein